MKLHLKNIKRRLKNIKQPLNKMKLHLKSMKRRLKNMKLRLKNLKLRLKNLKRYSKLLKRRLKVCDFLIIIATLLTACNSLLDNPTTDHADAEVELGFTVYFIDVGQADSALIVCDGKTMLIDGGNVSDSSRIYSFLERRGISKLDYIIATHAHEDHVGGLAGALNYAKVNIAYSPVTSYDSAAFNNFIKYLGEQNVSVTVPTHGDSFWLGSAEVMIVGPIRSSDESNNTSIVIRIVYGDTSFLFTGDAEREEEQDILEVGYDISATVLKVGHHGSDTSTTYPFLREIMPQYAVISCGSGNIYGHPHDNLLSRLRDADAVTYRTDLQGTITCTSDGAAVNFKTERNTTVRPNPTATSAQAITYIGNINTKKFHLPTCSGLPQEKNRTFFDSREEALDAGYSPCGTCKP